MSEISERTKLDKVIHTAMDSYVNSPAIRALAATLKLAEPVSPEAILAATLDEMLVILFTNAEKRRLRNLMNELYEGRKYITEDLIREEPFLYAFHAVARATALTYQQEKIRLFARLLINACRYKKLQSNEFEENLKILDELSTHEYKLLLIFREHEKQLREKVLKEPGEQHRKPQWNLLVADAENQLDIPGEDLNSTLTRLARTGLYQPAISFVSSETLGNGSTTPKLDKFLRWILDENTDKE